jgi:hypothetical protein
MAPRTSNPAKAKTLWACALCALALLLPLAGQAAPCVDCVDGLEAPDCQPGSPACGCCLGFLPADSPAMGPEPTLASRPHRGLLPTLPSLDVSAEILHVPRR